MRATKRPARLGVLVLISAVLIAGCSSPAAPQPGMETDETLPAGIPSPIGEADANDDLEREAERLSLPDLEPNDGSGGPLEVLATTSIIGDVVGRVGGEAIELTTLLEPGQDSHSFQPAARQLAAAAEARVIFVNGWDLEEGLVHDLEEIGGDVPIVPISADIDPLASGESEHEEGQEGEDHHHEGADPHVWFDVGNVEQWVENVEEVLSDLDPANREAYRQNALAYRAELAELEDYILTQVDRVPADRRFLVTNHDAMSYFARAYGFTVLGTVIPAASTLAEPSASDLADLIVLMQAYNVCSIFTETSVGDALAQTVASGLEDCEAVKVLALYTESVGPAGSGADSYIGMMRHNIDVIVEALKAGN